MDIFRVGPAVGPGVAEEHVVRLRSCHDSPADGFEVARLLRRIGDGRRARLARTGGRCDVPPPRLLLDRLPLVRAGAIGAGYDGYDGGAE